MNGKGQDQATGLMPPDFVPRAQPVGQPDFAPRALPVQPPPPAPSAPRAKLAPGAANEYSGLASTFATQDDLDAYNNAKAHGATEEQALRVGDNGIGNADLGTISTPSSYGIAAPRQYLIRHFGNDPANWRTARGELTYNGQTIRVPFVDLGPGKEPQNRGVITDLTSPLAEGLGTGGMGQVTLRYIPNAGPDYTKDPDAWYQEQGNIAQRFANNPAAQIGAEPAPTPYGKRVTPPPPVPVSEEASAAPGQGWFGVGGYGAAVNA